MKKLFVVLLIILFAAPAFAVDVCLEWNPNSEPDLAGYKIFYRESGQAYDYSNPAWQGQETTCRVSGLIQGDSYYFTGRAYDTEGYESVDCPEVFHRKPFDWENVRPGPMEGIHIYEAD